jgi:hypothetical protein
LPASPLQPTVSYQTVPAFSRSIISGLRTARRGDRLYPGNDQVDQSQRDRMHGAADDEKWNVSELLPVLGPIIMRVPGNEGRNKAGNVAAEKLGNTNGMSNVAGVAVSSMSAQRQSGESALPANSSRMKSDRGEVAKEWSF